MSTPVPRPRRSRSAAVLGVLLAGVALRPAAAAPPVFLDPEDIRPGMRATVRTVLQGTAITDLTVEILSVVHSTGPGQDLILARALGEPLESQGVSQGMSGSPAYVDGKLLGAVSTAWSFAKEPLLGITPARQMQAEAARSAQDASPPAKPGPRATPLDPRRAPPAPAADRRGMAPIGAPLVLSGFDSRVVALAADWLSPWGFTVTEGGTAGRTQKGGAIEPGATLGVRLAGGDVDMTAIGTVTWVDGDRVHGWGHPFFQAGDVEMPLVTGYIHAVIPSQAISFKMGSGGDVVGTITNDRRSGISGRLGRMPRLTSFDLVIRDADGGETKHHYELLRDRHLGPVLVGLVATSSLLASEGLIADETVRFRQRLVLEDGRDTVVETMFTGEQTVERIATLLSQATTALAQNPFEDVKVDRIEAEIVLEPGIRAGFLTGVTLDDDTPRPGDTLTGTYVLRDYRGARSTHRFRIPLPEDAREGRYLLLLADAATAEQYEAERDPRSYRPETLDELLERIRRLARTDAVHVHLYRQSQGVQVDGRPLPDLPASALSILGGAARSGVAEELPAEIVHREAVPTGTFVQGGHTILFEVRKEKP